jgi:hypothetical protein
MDVTTHELGLLSVRSWSYADLVQVFVTSHGAHFHSEVTCPRIRMGQASKHSSAPAHAVPISSIDGLSPCRSCYPDAPRIKFLKRRCKECGSARPCAHNGGVRVLVPAVYRRGSALLPAGTVIYRRRWVWPDVAWMYQPVGETE